MSSTKSAIGHLLGAAGAVGGDLLDPCHSRQRRAADHQSGNPSVRETAIDLVPHQGAAAPVNVALSNSFGFGGTNASLIFRRFDADLNANCACRLPGTSLSPYSRLVGRLRSVLEAMSGPATPSRLRPMHGRPLRPEERPEPAASAQPRRGAEAAGRPAAAAAPSRLRACMIVVFKPAEAFLIAVCWRVLGAAVYFGKRSSSTGPGRCRPRPSWSSPKAGGARHRRPPRTEGLITDATIF